MSTHARAEFVRNLAAAFLTGDWLADDIVAAAKQVVGRRTKWAAPLASRVVTAFTRRPSFSRLHDFLVEDPELCRAGKRIDWQKHQWRRLGQLRRSVQMGQPPAAMEPLQIPGLPSENSLAGWLGLTGGELRWYADLSGRNRRHPPGPLRAYRYRWVPKPARRSRLLEIPTGRLKQIQRKILTELLNPIPTHPAAHGFRVGRSVVTNALPHCGKQVVLRFDLADFFPSISAARIGAIFRTVGYPETVARLLGGICTTRLPRDIWDARPNPARDGTEHPAWQRLAARHLPQGAPTSPTLANLVTFRLDRRLAKLAAQIGADYTRYADDLTFSGGAELARQSRRLAHLVAVIVGEEGFTLNHRKTRVMGRAARQTVTGLAVNIRPSVPRADFDRLKAILTNCVRHAPQDQNRDRHPDFRAHLAGRVSHVALVNLARGRKLWAIFDRIVWDQATDGSNPTGPS